MAPENVTSVESAASKGKYCHCQRICLTQDAIIGGNIEMDRKEKRKTGSTKKGDIFIYIYIYFRLGGYWICNRGHSELYR